MLKEDSLVRRCFGVFVAVLLVGMLTSGCGGSNDSSTPTAPSTTTPTRDIWTTESGVRTSTSLDGLSWGGFGHLER